jgi:hypothetical protein
MEPRFGNMRITLFILSLVAAAGGAALLSVAESSTDELSALMLFAVAVTMLSAAAVVEVVTRCLQAAGRTNETLSRIAEELEDARKDDASGWDGAVVSEPAYVVRTGNDSSGPFPVDKIKELRRRGAIDDDTPVALAGRNEWRRTCEVIGV